MYIYKGDASTFIVILLLEISQEAIQLKENKRNVAKFEEAILTVIARISDELGRIALENNLEKDDQIDQPLRSHFCLFHMNPAKNIFCFEIMHTSQIQRAI
mmetsp:Transcript_53624/g.61468  ORF Transcript_53624/g.61468 Transcript_53624/m.61468 type:complete len:101 (-) Transcript_53624:13-315(-)